MFVPTVLRYHHLQSYTRDEGLMAELAAYTDNAFERSGQAIRRQVFTDEPQISAWERYVAEAGTRGVFRTLQKFIVQFQFPIKENLYLTNDYKNATLRGVATSGMPIASGLILREPEKLQLFLYPSLAGKIPVIIAHNRDDFQSVVRALSCRNEPQPIPESMGAAMIQGLNNWDRLTALKLERQLNEHPSALSANNLLSNKALYQDRIIVLSQIPYSNVSAEEMNWSAAEWLDASLKIRLEHECAHYFTLRAFGTMANNMHDELIADYMGITAVLPQFSSKWFLKFIGLEHYPVFRSSGRLKNYLGKPPLSPAACKILQIIVKQAAEHVEHFDLALGKSRDDPDRQCRMLSLCAVNLIEIAAEDGVELLLKAYNKLQEKL